MQQEGTRGIRRALIAMQRRYQAAFDPGEAIEQSPLAGHLDRYLGVCRWVLQRIGTAIPPGSSIALAVLQLLLLLCHPVRDAEPC